MEKIYPKLKEYCQSIGYDFQVVDMRWGVRDEATDDHMTSETLHERIKSLSTAFNWTQFHCELIDISFQKIVKSRDHNCFVQENFYVPEVEVKF